MRQVLGMCLILSAGSLLAQGSRATGFTTGYTWNFGDEALKDRHMIELGFYYVGDNKALNKYVANDFIFGNSFTIVPRVGGTFPFKLFNFIKGHIGSELAYYTDFSRGQLTLVPYVGLGNDSTLKISFKPQVELAGNLGTINPFSLSLSFAFLNCRWSWSDSDSKPRGFFPCFRDDFP